MDELDKSLVRVSKVEKKHRGEEAMKQIEDHQSEIETLSNVKKMLFKQNKELNSKLLISNEKNEKLQQKLNDTIKSYQEKFTQLEREKAHELNQKTEALKTKFDNEINLKIVEFKDDKNLLREAHSADMKTLQHQFESQIQTVRDELEQMKAKVLFFA